MPSSEILVAFAARLKYPNHEANSTVKTVLSSSEIVAVLAEIIGPWIGDGTAVGRYRDLLGKRPPQEK